MTGTGTTVTVVGVGNPIMGDDGVGLELLAAVRARCPGWDDRVDWVDGGTAGMALVPVVQDASALLILDAVAGDTPGEVVELTGDQIPRLLSVKLSPHQVSLLDVFAAARLLGREPADVAVVGVVPESVDLRVGLSPVVAGAVPTASALAARRVARWLGCVDEPAGETGSTDAV